MNQQGHLARKELEQLDREDSSVGGTILPLLLESLKDPNPRARILAIREISDHTDVAVMDRLIDLAQHDPNPEARCAAIAGLGNFIYIGASSAYDPETDQELGCVDDCLSDADFERVYVFLQSAYRDEQRSLDERRYTIESLSYFGNDTVESLIAELYARPEKRARSSALIAMGNSGSARWVDILRQELYNSDPDLQIEAITAAGELGVDTLGKDLLRLTFSEDRDVVLSALWSLGQTGWDGAFDRLDELTLHQDPEVREVADEAMEEWLFYNGLSSTYEESEDQDLSQDPQGVEDLSLSEIS